MIRASAVLLALAGGVAAGPREYHVEVWDTDRGLPSTFVTSLAQTPDGYLWAGTHAGLVRFDGVRFTVFDAASTPALAHSRIEQLFVDPEGTLWISSYDGSIASCREGTFIREWTGAGGESRAFLASSGNGRPIFVFDDGTVIRRRAAHTASWETLPAPGAPFVPLFAEGTDGLWVRSVDDRLWRLAGDRFEEVSREGLLGTGIWHLAADGGGRVWVGTDKEVAVFDGERFRRVTPAGVEAFPGAHLLLLCRDGSYWVVAGGRPRHAQGGRWVGDAGLVHDLSGYYRLSVSALEDRRGGVWFRHVGRGLVHVRKDGTARRIGAAEGLPGEAVRACLEDAEGNLWAAVERGGLVRIRETPFHVLSAAEGLGAQAASTVAEDVSGTVWIGTHGAGLRSLRDGVLRAYPLPSAATGGFVLSLHPDRRGRIWLSGDREELFIWEKGRIRSTSWGVRRIKSILVDRLDRVWLGTRDGLHRIEDGRLKTFGVADGFEPHDVRALAEDLSGDVWVGTGDGTVYNVASERFSRFRPPGLRSGQGVWSLRPDARGTVWVGTSGGGLMRLEGGRFSRYTSHDGLPSDVICEILDDGVGTLWVGSQRGLFSVGKEDLDAFAAGRLQRVPVRGYGHSEGFPTTECSGLHHPSAWRGHDGRLWFATSRGVASLRPADVTGSLVPPAALIEDVRLDGAPQALPAPGAALAVAPGGRNVEFRYTAPGLVAPETVRFRCRLEGLPGDWVEAGDRRSFQYGYLPPGRYRFAVAAAYGDGDWGKEAAVSIEVLPRLTEQAWFRVLAALGVVAVVAVGARSASARRFRRELERLEWQRAVERDRARISKDIHDDLGAGLSEIGLLCDLARREGLPGAEAHLEQISGTARELVHNMDEIVWAVNPRHDTLPSLVTYICMFADEYLTLADIELRLDLPATVPPLPLTSDVRHNLFLAVKETLRNVVTHAHARQVDLRLRGEGPRLAIGIEDDGAGFDVLAVEAGGLGEGLRSLRERLAAIGGRAEVHSRPGQGTRVELVVDLK